MVAVVAALATHELAVVLPALLLLRGLVDLPGLSRRQLVRLGVQHAPFWGLLGAYFILRKVIFGHYLGGGTQAPVWAIIADMARAARELWLSPTASSNAPVALVVAGAIAVLFILLAPLLVDRGPALRDHALPQKSPTLASPGCFCRQLRWRSVGTTTRATSRSPQSAWPWRLACPRRAR